MFIFFFREKQRNIKYSDEEIRAILYEYDLYLDKYENAKSIYAHDEIGYKYHFTLSNLKIGRKPDWLQNNPYAMDNIRLFLSINYPDYELLDTKYVSCKNKMRFICHKHEEHGTQLNSFDNIVHNHHACKYCGYSMLSEIKRLPDSQLTEMCIERDVIFVGRKQYDRQTHILYKCTKHDSDELQEMTLDHFRASKVPCRICQISSGELKVKQYLDEHKIKYVYQHTFPDCRNVRPLEFDFYLPTLLVAIEYDGKQHFEPMHFSNSDKTYLESYELGKQRDRIKDQYCLEHAIRMIRIPYWDYDKIDSILQEKLYI